MKKIKNKLNLIDTGIDTNSIFVVYLKLTQLHEYLECIYTSK